MTMKRRMCHSVMTTLIIVVLLAAGRAQAEPTYAADVPESVTTPDIVRTESLGKLEFFDGMPSKKMGSSLLLTHVDKFYILKHVTST